MGLSVHAVKRLEVQVDFPWGKRHYNLSSIWFRSCFSLFFCRLNPILRAIIRLVKHWNKKDRPSVIETLQLSTTGAAKGHVTRSNFSCNLQRNVCCVASCQKKFTRNTPFCNCNCCVASCNKSRTTLHFSQRCETSCLRVTSPQQLATQFCPEWANQSSSFARLVRPLSCLLVYAVQVVKKVANVTPPSETWEVFHSSSLRCKLQEKLLRVTWP